MVPNKLDRKYYVWIWVCLVFASFIRNIYPIYNSFIGIEVGSASALVINIVYILFVCGLIPTFLCYLCSSIVYSFGFRRYVRLISRNDFIYWVMIFTASARAFMGIIDAFSILEPNIYVITSSMLDVTVLTFALYMMYFFVFVPKYNFNPVEKFNSFSYWSMLYFIFLGVITIVPSVMMLLLSDGSVTSSQLLELLKQYYGLTYTIGELQIIGSSITLAVYTVYVIATIVISEILRKKARDYRHPEKCEENIFASAFQNNHSKNDNRNSHPFGEDGSDVDSDLGSQSKKHHGKDDKVFDEFDI